MQFHQPAYNVLESKEGSLLPFKVHVPQACDDSFRIVNSAVGLLESSDVPDPKSAVPVLERLANEAKVLVILLELPNPSNVCSRYDC